MIGIVLKQALKLERQIPRQSLEYAGSTLSTMWMVSGRVLSSGFDKFQEFGKADGKTIVVDAFFGTVELNAGFFTSMIFF